MTTRRGGFTLVELLVVTVLAAITLAAVYETLIKQEESYRAGGAMIAGQETVRTALGVLEAELREIAAIDDGVAGGGDIRIAAPDSIVFRAQRKIGFICEVSKSEKWAVAWSLGDPFAAGDSLLLFVDGDSIRYQDDSWAPAQVNSATATSSATCEAEWPGVQLQKIGLSGHDLTGVQLGSPVRSFDWVTYGLYRFGGMGWGLGRHGRDEPARYLVGNIAENGLRFRYFDVNGDATGDPAAVNRIQIAVQTRPPEGTGVESTNMTTNLFLRNN